MTYRNAYIPFTPSQSEQRLPPPYYRGCWHGVSRGFLSGYCHPFDLLNHRYSSLVTEVYNPKTFIPHAASHCHPFGHCKRFSTAASRRSLGSVSVPMWLTTLSGQLPVKSLGRPLPYQQADRTWAHHSVAGPLRDPRLLPLCHAAVWSYLVLAPLSRCYPSLNGRLPTHYSPVCHYPLRDRTTCMPNPRRQRSF